ENLRIAAAQFPRLKERRPVDERLDFLEREIVDDAHAGERRRGRRGVVELRFAAARFVDREQRPRLLARGVLRAKANVFIANLLIEFGTLIAAQQRADDADRARGIEHVYR